MWRDGFPMLSGALISHGDADNDDDVDGADFLVWQQQLGAPAAAANSIAAPEPVASGIMVAGFLGLLHIRRR
jgi:hypothetical protein